SAILDRELPDIVHFHAFTRGVSVPMVEEVKRRNLQLVFTYHTPAASCQRGTLLRYGEQPCEGNLNLTACARCTLHGLGLNRIAASLLSSIPPNIGTALGSIGANGRFLTALRMTELTEIRHDAFRQLTRQSDAI